MPMVTKLGRMVTYCEGFPPIKSHDPWVHGLLRSCDKVKPLYPQYHNVYDPKACWGGDITLGAVTHKLIGSFNCVVL